MKLNNIQAAEVILDLQEDGVPTLNEAITRAYFALMFFDELELDEKIAEYENYRDSRRKGENVYESYTGASS